MAETQQITNSLQSLDRMMVTLIDGATEKGAALVDFLYVQAPEVISQLLLWHGIESFVQCIGGLFVLFIIPLIFAKLLMLYKTFFENHIDKDWSEHPGFLVPSVIVSVCTIAFTQLIGWSMLNLTWLKIWIAPKVYLLEFVTHLSK